MSSASCSWETWLPMVTKRDGSSPRGTCLLWHGSSMSRCFLGTATSPVESPSSSRAPPGEEVPLAALPALPVEGSMATAGPLAAILRWPTMIVQVETQVPSYLARQMSRVAYADIGDAVTT